MEFGNNNFLPEPKELPLRTNYSHGKYKLIFYLIIGITAYFIFTGRFSFKFMDNPYLKILYHYIAAKGLVFIIILPYFLMNCLKYMKYRRIMEDTPTSKIRSASMGMVEIKGIAKRKFNTLSPVSKLPSVYYRVKKYKRSGSAEESAGWMWYETEVSGMSPFYVEDETGRVLVYPMSAEFHGIKKETHVNMGGLFVPGMTYCVPVNQKWEEELILDNSPVYILGWAEYPHNQNSEIKDIRLDILRKLKKDRSKLMEYDENQDGTIDSYEWEKAVSDADREAYRKYLEMTHRNRESFIITDPPYRGFPMIIAPTKMEEKLWKKYYYLFMINLFLSILSASIGSILLFF